MPSLIDDTQCEVLRIVRCGDLEDDWCCKCNKGFARDVVGNILRGRRKSIKDNYYGMDNNMGINRWQHLECWDGRHSAITSLFEGEVDPCIVLSAFQNAVTPCQTFSHDILADSSQPLL